MNKKPSPRPRGSISSLMSANWPWPPVWRLSLECCDTLRRIVSLNAIFGAAVVI